jgi:hypothetical protein
MKQNAEMARHYGVLRFAMFTVFVTIIGALIHLPFDKDAAVLVFLNPQKWFIGVSGIILSIGFIAAEIRVSRLISFYQEKSFADNQQIALPEDHAYWKHLIPIIMISPFVLSIAFWTLFLSGCLRPD